MKVIYSGKTKDFTPQIEKKVEEKLMKMGKMIEQRGEKSAQILHRQERHLHKIEISTHVYDHALLAKAEESDLTTALCEALEKLEKQIVKLCCRWRDLHRDAKVLREQKEATADREPISKAAKPAAPATKKNGNGNGFAKLAKPRVFRVAPDGDAKPMTLEEALLEMQGKKTQESEEYMVYRDQNRSSLSVLFRRRDGHFDLIEA